MRVTYYGQACTLIEAAGRRILTDPWLTEGAYLGTWFHTHVLAEAGVSPATICKDIDYLVLSHEHEDHCDVTTLSEFPRNIPILICRFATAKFRQYLAGLGFVDIRELTSGEPVHLGDGLEVTILGSAEYTNDAAVLVSGDGHTVFNETDCKLAYQDLERLRDRNIDLGFYMFSGANWFPMLYDTPPEVKLEQVRRRRRSLVRGFVERVKITRPRIAVPAAGPCTVLDPDLLWLNSPEHGIFIDPEDAVAAVRAANLGVEAVNMAATDVWDSDRGIERQAPDSFRLPREEYIAMAAARYADAIRARKEDEPAAGADLPERLTAFFEHHVAAQTPAMRQRIGAIVGLDVAGRQGGQYTVDFTTAQPPYVREGLSPDWTYRIDVEDKVIYPFMSGQIPFLEDLFLTLRLQLARRPDVYNEALYHFLYEPDPKKLEQWYASR